MIAQHSSASNEHYTPAYIVEAARKLMGSIDLDPASCEEANKTVKANVFVTQNDDGLSFPWFGNVFLNPPGGKLRLVHDVKGSKWYPIKDGPGESSQMVWFDKLACSYEDGLIQQGFFVSFNLEILRISQHWDYPIQRYFRCYPEDRIKYSGGSPPHPSMFAWLPPSRSWLLGGNAAKAIQEKLLYQFEDCFSGIGLCEPGYL